MGKFHLAAIVLAAVLLTAPQAYADFFDQLETDLGEAADIVGNSIEDTINNSVGGGQDESGQQQNGEQNQTAPEAPEAGTVTQPATEQATVNTQIELTLEAQDRLNKLGYDAGPVDGSYGPRTGNAVKAFQSDHGMAPDGQITQGLVDALRAAEAEAPQVAQASQDAAAGAEATGIAGTWVGEYVCGQGPTALELTIADEVNNEVSAVFAFSATEDNPTVPSGSLRMHGPFDPKTRQIKLDPGEWIEHPPGYQTVGVTGRFDPGLTNFVGKVMAGGCQAFTLARAGEASEPETAEQSAPEPTEATTGATPLSVGSQRFIDSLFSPEGISIGMTAGQAIEILETKGYQRTHFCRYERTDLLTDNRFYFTFDAALPGPPTEPSLEQLSQGLSDTCEPDERVVTRIEYKEQLARDFQPDDAEGEIKRIEELVGPYRYCNQMLPTTAKDCSWSSPSLDPKVRTLIVSVGNGWGRSIELEYEPLEVTPDDPDRVAQRAAATAEALSVCQNYGAGMGGTADMLRQLYDCQCTAELIGRAYAKGLVDDITVQTVDDYLKDCPGDHDRVVTYFYEQCLTNYGNQNRDWAANGGCVCYGDSAGTSFLRDPRNPSGGGSNAILECGMLDGTVPPEYAGMTAPAGQAGAAVQSGTAPVLAAVGDAPAGIRPLEMWVEVGRPVVYGNYSPKTPMDSTFDAATQEREAARYLGLLALGEAPGLADDDEVLRLLAATNLPYDRRAEYLTQCDRPDASATYCEWAGTDEFEIYALVKDLRENFLPGLIAFAKTMPREFVYVEEVTHGEYDAGAGGFPLSRTQNLMVSGDSQGFQLYGETMVGRLMLMGNQLDLPKVWELSASNAEEVVGRIKARAQGQNANQARFLDAAWTFKVTGVRVPDYEYATNVRDIDVETLDLRLFVDARLTDPLVSLLHAEAGPAEMTEASDGSAQSTALVMKPFEHRLQDGELLVRLTPTQSVDDASLRYVNLMILGRYPELAQEPENALLLAHQNIIGLTLPIDPPKDWAGDDEFERGRNEDAFRGEGAAQVIALAPALPQELVLEHTIVLGPYDFDTGAFPILKSGMSRSYAREGEQVFTPYSSSILDGSGIVMGWRNGGLPETWQIRMEDAQAIVGLLEQHGDRRNLYAETNVVFHDVKSRESGDWLFDTEIVGIDLYADQGHTTKIGTLPVN